VLAKMAERVSEAEAALIAWNPAARRLQAARAKPVEAAALADRLAREGLRGLEDLARHAVRDGDDLLADGIATAVGRLQDGAAGKPEVAEAARRALAALDEMDAGPRAALRVQAGRVFAAEAEGRILAAELTGHPLPPEKRLTIIRTADAKVAAA